MPPSNADAEFDGLVGVIETLQERIKSDAVIGRNETRTRDALITPLLKALGWETPVLVPEYQTRHGIADYALLESSEAVGRPIALVEAKRMNDDLNEEHRNQVFDYARDRESVEYVGLTNGDIWKFYQLIEQGQRQPILEVSLRDEPAHTCAEQLGRLRRGKQGFTGPGGSLPLRVAPRSASAGVRVSDQESTGEPNRLFVGNIPFRMTQEELHALFSQAGVVVSVDIPPDRETGRSRGFGFVQMEDDTSKEQAVRMLNGYSVSGRALTVEDARRGDQPSHSSHSSAQDTGSEQPDSAGTTDKAEAAGPALETSQRAMKPEVMSPLPSWLNAAYLWLAAGFVVAGAVGWLAGFWATGPVLEGLWFVGAAAVAVVAAAAIAFVWLFVKPPVKQIWRSRSTLSGKTQVWLCFTIYFGAVFGMVAGSVMAQPLSDLLAVTGTVLVAFAVITAMFAVLGGAGFVAWKALKR